MKHQQKKPKTTKAGKARKSPKTAAVAPAARAEKAPRTPRTRERDPRLPAPGTVLTRKYKDREIRVTVLEDGFRWDGKEYRSLTAIARLATGYPAISGPAWFSLTERAATTPKPSKRREKPTAADPTATQEPAPATVSATA